MHRVKHQHITATKKKLPQAKKEHTFFLIAVCIMVTVLSGFFPVSETSISKELRKTLSTTSQTFFSTLLTKKKETPQDFMIMQVGIGAQKMVVTPTLPPQTVAATWGKATQIDEHTWTMKIQSDTHMATAQEIFAALNTYRHEKGKSTLSWDDKLAQYAEERAAFFTSNGKLDGHAGFQSFMDNDGFSKLGFSALGENSSFGYLLEGVHLIEWVYAGDAPHDTNQLNSEWTHVGIGVNGTSTDLIFGGLKR